MRSLLVIVSLLLSATLSHAQEATPVSAVVELMGVGPHTIELSSESLSGLPSVERDVTFQTSKGQQTGHYKGVLFWDVLQANKAFEKMGHNGELKRTFLVTAQDGYEVAFSVGEIHPDFGNAQLILASQVDGKAVGWRFVMPGDKRGARAIYDVRTIELR